MRFTVDGRLDETVVTPEGLAVSGSCLVDAFLNCRGVAFVKIIQLSDELFLVEYMPDPVAKEAFTGEVAGVSTYAQGSSQAFNMYQLRPTGTPNQYDVVYDSGTIRPNGDAGSVQSFAFPNGPTDVHPGDVFAHYGRGIPWSLSGGTNAANPQRIYHPSPTPPTQAPLRGRVGADLYCISL